MPEPLLANTTVSCHGNKHEHDIPYFAQLGLAEKIFAGLLFSLISAFGIVLNAVVITVIKTRNHLYEQNSHLIFSSMCVTNVLNCIFILIPDTIKLVSHKASAEFLLLSVSFN